MKDKKTIVYISYFPDEDDRIAEITNDEFELLKPYMDELAMGRTISDEKINNLVYKIQERSIEIRRIDVPDKYDIEVAIC